MTGLESTTDIAIADAQPTPVRPIQMLLLKAPNSRQPLLALALRTPFVGKELGPWFTLFLETVTAFPFGSFVPHAGLAMDTGLHVHLLQVIQHALHKPIWAIEGTAD